MRTERRTLLKFLGTAAVALWIGAASLAQPAVAAEKVTVFAAASLKNALDAIDAEWKKESGKETTVSYAASSALAKQIEIRRTGRRLHLCRSGLDGLRR